nr:hypothetical protein [Tanacetum cinerariifolium]
LKYKNVQPKYSDSSIDEYSSDDVEDVDNVEFYNTVEEDVVVANMTTRDDFLNGLCSNSGLFRGSNPKTVPGEPNLPKDDTDSSTIDHQFKIKICVVCLVFNPNIPWIQMEPVLEMRNVEEGRCAGKKGKKDMVLNKNRKKKADLPKTSKKANNAKNGIKS